MDKFSWLKVVTTGLAISATISGSVYASTIPSDIKGHWAEKQITTWLDEGLITGYKNGSFKPNNSMTRAEFITLVNKAYKFNKQIPISFSDVKKNDWFYSEIAKSQAAGYISGYSDGTVRPNEKISRQEVAAILVKLTGLNITDNGVSTLTDVNKQWGQGAINAVISRGYMHGYPNKTFRPANSISRAEAVETLDNVIHMAVVNGSTESSLTPNQNLTNVQPSPGAPAQTGGTSTTTSVSNTQGRDSSHSGGSFNNNGGTVTNGVYHASTPNGQITIQGVGGTSPSPNLNGIIDSNGCTPDIHQFPQGGHMVFAIDIQTTDVSLPNTSLNPVVQIWTTDANPTKVAELPMKYEAHPPTAPPAQQKHFWTVGQPVNFATGDYQYKFVVAGKYVFSPDNHTFTIVSAVPPTDPGTVTNGVYHATTPNGQITIQGAGGASPNPNPNGIIDGNGCTPDIHQFPQGGHMAFALDIQTTDASLPNDSLNPVVQVWTTDANPTKVAEVSMTYGAHPPTAPPAQQKHFWAAGLPINLATGDYQYKFVVASKYVFVPDNHTFTIVSTVPTTGGTDSSAGSAAPTTGGTDSSAGSAAPTTGGTDSSAGSAAPTTGGTDSSTGSAVPSTGSTAPLTGGTTSTTDSSLSNTIGTVTNGTETGGTLN